MKKRTYKLLSIVFTILFIFLAVEIANAYFWTHYKVQSPIVIHLQAPVVPLERKIISPMATSSARMVQQAYAESFKTPRYDNPARQEIADYVTQVFGKDAQRAFLLLECENKSLNPEATSATHDYGVFQINTHWQQTQPKFLMNYKINVEIAKQLFDENGKSFNLWTCGRGI